MKLTISFASFDTSGWGSAARRISDRHTDVYTLLKGREIAVPPAMEVPDEHLRRLTDWPKAALASLGSRLVVEAEGWKGRNWPEPEAVEVKGQAMRSFGKRPADDLCWCVSEITVFQKCLSIWSVQIQDKFLKISHAFSSSFSVLLYHSAAKYVM